MARRNAFKYVRGTVQDACLGGFLRDFYIFFLLKYSKFDFWYYMAFGRIWQHAKYSYGVWQSFALNSENFQKIHKIEKCKQFSRMFGFGATQ
jgi:hypothetical protein